MDLRKGDGWGTVTAHAPGGQAANLMIRIRASFLKNPLDGATYAGADNWVDNVKNPSIKFGVVQVYQGDLRWSAGPIEIFWT